MWLRLRQIALVCHAIKAVGDDLTSILGIEVAHCDPGLAKYGLENILLPLGNTLIEVVAPIAEGSAGGRYLERRGGDGRYMVITQCDEQAPRRARIEALGIRIVSDFTRPTFKNMQLHPRDTDGSFFEIDEQLGDRALDPDGTWDAVGGDGWQAHRRTDVVRAVTAAEMQCDDPAATASRWGDIAELPVTTDAAGRLSIALDNATLRFVPISDGRPEGLSALDLEVADRPRLLAAARERGAYRSDDLVYTCGMRLHLV